MKTVYTVESSKRKYRVVDARDWKMDYSVEAEVPGGFQTIMFRKHLKDAKDLADGLARLDDR